MLVLDWNFEPIIDDGLREANIEYVASDVMEVITSMASTAALNDSFARELRSGSLPNVDVRRPCLRR